MRAPASPASKLRAIRAALAGASFLPRSIERLQTGAVQSVRCGLAQTGERYGAVYFAAVAAREVR